MRRTDVPAPIKEAGRSLTRIVGRATAGLRMLPSFLVVGTQRGGTTSLHRALVEHPAVVAPAFHKGIHWFDVAREHSPSWYRGHFPLVSAARRRVPQGQLPVTFESSGYYMHHPTAPAAIGTTLPDVKLVVMLRDPVERAYSAHRHELARGFETEPFERALALEDERLDGEVARIVADPGYVSHAHRHHSYVDRSTYVWQVERLFLLFGRERVHVLFSEDFFRSPDTVFADLLDFLGLAPDTPRFGHHNDQPRAPMAPDLRARLEERFLPHDDALAELLGVELGWRR